MATDKRGMISMPWLGEARLSLSNMPRIGWLIMDGTTEYNRADYPNFVNRFSSESWFLPGSTPTTFKLIDARDLNVATGGKSYGIGKVVGNTDIKLTMQNIPEHDHGYNAPDTATTNQQVATGGVLGLVLNTLGLAKPGATKSGTTGKAGAASPSAIPLTPKSITFYIYVFAGISGLRGQGATP